MGNRYLIVTLLISSMIFLSCKEFRGEKLELNYKKGYVKILSEDYIIDSLVVRNHTNKYYIIGLVNKSKGDNVIYFNQINFNYTIYQDSLNYYCSKVSDINLPGLDVYIRKKGFLGSGQIENCTNMEYFNYNQIPCNVKIVDTIEALNPYK
ncbi:hypothetical protein R1T16_01690 [Flavobacterium sp. DG1-102-2]|uniref:hypothetical protein n=1 Tax=Flavobacterium sp. DG1-102-2 TaxID=3081663 RepID=UPI002948EEDE|nr:hypothetical protein [Flavobacterium sp. DG1-102-2]MDV6167117.1 hypothetical protein [Flavobacterium sp. DG1-102-2]